MHLSMEHIPGMLFYCAGAFRFMSESLLLATVLIEEGAISVIADHLKADLQDEIVAGNLVITLVNLTRVNGKEGQVVEQMIHQVRFNPLAAIDKTSCACVLPLKLTAPFLRRSVPLRPRRRCSAS